ncbi:MAG: YkgJ family cysteine cluster protein [Promethearchaeota archaeon]
MDPFTCSRCARCCYFPEGLEKKIPVYPEEARVLEGLASRSGVPLRLLEDFVLPDVKNERVLVGRYKLLPGEGGSCPFLSESGCTIYENRPLACRAYPLAVKLVDAFTREFFIDKMCPVIGERAAEIEGAGPGGVGDLFPEEGRWARKLDAREKDISLSIRHLTAKREVEIPSEFSAEAFNEALAKWDRADIDRDGRLLTGGRETCSQ